MFFNVLLVFFDKYTGFMRLEGKKREVAQHF